MQHRLLRTPLLALIAVIALAGVSAAGLTAQEATPGPISVMELAPNFTAEIFAAAPSDRAIAVGVEGSGRQGRRADVGASGQAQPR